MVSKRWVWILIALIVLTNAISLTVCITNKNNVVAKYEEEQAKLLATISAYGSEVTVYTVKTAVQPGEEITRDNIVPMTQCSSMVTDQMVQNVNDIIGKEFKIAVANGTPLTYNMVMAESVRADTRDKDIILDNWPVGLVAGDYIDIKIMMPYGDDYVVISHKRVYEVNESTLKLHLTVDEWESYVGAFVDYSLNAAYGCTIYADKYVEPGLQEAAITYYAVPTNIAALLQKNPNVTDKEAVATTNEWRSSIEEMLSIFRDEEDTVDTDGATLAEKRAQYTESVMADMNSRRENQQSNANAAEEEDEFDWSSTNPVGSADAIDDAVESAGDLQ